MQDEALKKIVSEVLCAEGGPVDGRLTHGNAVDSDVISARVISIKDDAPTRCGRADDRRDRQVSLELLDKLSENVDVRDHILNERTAVRAHLVCGEEEGLKKVISTSLTERSSG